MRDEVSEEQSAGTVDWATLAEVAERVARARAPASDVEDIIQATLEAVAQRVADQSWSQVDKPLAWVATVAARRCADVWVKHLRETEARVKLARLRPAASWSMPGPDAAYVDWAHELCELSYQESRCIILWTKGFSYREIGETLGIHEGSVSVYMNRARKKLRRTRP